MTRERGSHGGCAYDGRSILSRRGFVALLVFCVSLILLGAGSVVYERAAMRPDSDDFLIAGREFMSWLAMSPPSLETMMSHRLFPEYFMSSILLTIVSAGPGSSTIGVIVCNSVLFSSVVVLLFWVWVTVHGGWSYWLGRRGLLLGVGGGFYIIFGLPDVFLWSYTVLTDIIFLFWVSVFIVGTVRGILIGGGTAWAVAFAAAMTAPFVRPTGIVLPLLFMYGVFVKVALESNFPMRKISVASFLVPVGAVFVVVPWLVLMKLSVGTVIEFPGLDVLDSHLGRVARHFAQGTVVADRVEAAVEEPLRYAEIVKMMLVRVGYYLIPLRLSDPSYSPVHNMVNLIYVVVVWPLGVIGLVRLLRVSRCYHAVVLFLVMVSASYALLHSATLVGFSWRYQLPAMVPLWILVGTGFYTMLGYPIIRRRALVGEPEPQNL